MITCPSEEITSLCVHRNSHRALLRALVPLVDAVVVPASRPVSQLAVSVQIAQSLGAQFVALCSGNARSADFSEWICGRPGPRWLTIDIPSSYQHTLLDFATSKATEAKIERLGDLSIKRNLGLLLARLLGWRSVLFLDDDIHEVDITAVCRGAAALGTEAVVGLPVDDYPDNSVVCHANRHSGVVQDTFVSGAALLVDAHQVESFFPEIYNEDWMFLCRSVAKRKVAAAIGSARQLRYDPFAEPERARDEEFGEVLAEGLTSLMHPLPTHAMVPLDVGGTAFDPGYWKRFLQARAEFTYQIATRIEKKPREAATPAALRSLEAADDRRSSITAEQCAAYLKTWNRDTWNWREQWANMQRAGTLRQALAFLELLQYAYSPEL